MRGASLQLVLLSLPAFAGCLGTTTPLGGATGLLTLLPIPAFPIEEDHDHWDSLLHEGRANIDRIAYHSGFGNGTAASIPRGEGYSELFVRDNLLFLNRRPTEDRGKGELGGFIIFDIRDPAQPRKLSTFDGLGGYDVESTHDNQYAFFASQYLPNQQMNTVPPKGAGELPRAIHIVDIKNPERPNEVSLFPIPTRGAHTLTYFRTDAGMELLAAQTYNFVPDPSLNLTVPGFSGLGAETLEQRVLLFQFVRTPVAHLELLSTYERHDADPGLVPQRIDEYLPHDSAIQVHPVTKQLLMYVAYWDLGAFIVDITNPLMPTEIGHLDDFSPSQVRKIHLAAPAPELIDGRHVTITEPEFAGRPESGQYTFFDTTDPTKPVRLGFWTLPGGVMNLGNDLRFSPHNFMVDHGHLYLAHYHAGVWVIDIHNETLLKEPKALGYVQPTAARPDYPWNAPMIWGAIYHNGYVFASDMATGLHVLQFAADKATAAHGH